MEMTVTSFAAEFGISKGHASQILSGEKKPSLGLACRIWRKTGQKLGPLENASEADIPAYERLAGAA